MITFFRSKVILYAIIPVVAVTLTSFSLAKRVRPLENKKDNCVVSFQFTSTSTLQYAEVSHPSGGSVNNSNFTSWNSSVSGAASTGLVTFFVDFPSNNPPGTLTFKEGATTIFSLPVPRNTIVLYEWQHNINCSVDFVIDFQ